MININNISKSFNRKVILKNVSFKCTEGEMIAILGINGSGKSTLLNIISGFIKPDSGEIFFNNSNIFQDYQKHKKISGYMLETPFYVEKLTSKDFLYFFGKFYNIPQAQLLNRIEYLLDYLKIPNNNQLIENYSKGTKKKLSFITSILNNPKFLILDEPFNGLDHNSLKKSYELLQELKNTGTHIILSTHNVEQIFDILDTFILLKSGTVALVESKNYIEKSAISKYGTIKNNISKYIAEIIEN